MDRQLRQKVRQDFYEWKNLVNNFNRFDTRHPLLNILENNQELFSCRVAKGLSFFRGRIFNLSDVASNDEEINAFIESDEKDFQGYDKDKSGAPPNEFAIEGRLNCKGISFLYTCSDSKTVIYELRPIKNETISIAEFVTNRDLRFADLRKRRPRDLNNDDVLYPLLSKIANEFSKPHYIGHNYWFTQYLAGQFINMGFDGVLFKSSLYPEGDNLVFFYPEDCSAVNSRLYKVDKIAITFESITRETLL